MRPILLTIEGLQSFREAQTVRFDELSDAGVFGIFGPTGSGKSTILDAISLALYAKVFRAERDTQGILNHAEKNLSVSFRFQIGVGTERKIYQVERTYKRTGDYTVGHNASRLRELDANGETLSVVEGKGEVTDKVQEILGLEPRDFFRAVVLPQGQFADFLKLSGADRRAMLQKLFALERCGSQLNERLKTRLQTVKEELINITSEQAGMGDCSQEAVAQAAARLEAAMQKEREAVAEFQRIEQEFAAKQKRVELQVQIQQTQAQLDELLAKAPEIHLLAEKLARAEQVAQVQPAIATCRQLAAEQQTMDAERSTLTAAVEALRLESEQVGKGFEAARKEKDDTTPQLIEKKAKIRQAIEWETEVAKLQKKVEDLSQQAAAERDRRETAQQHIQDLTSRQTTCKQELAAEKIRLEQNTVPVEYRSKLAAALQKQELYQTALAEVQKAEQELTARQKAADLAKQELATAKQRAETLQGQVEQQQQIAEELKQQPPAAESVLQQQAERLAECKGDVERLRRLEQDVTDQKQRRQTATDAQEQLTAKLTAVQAKLTTARENVLRLRQLQQDLLRQNKRAMALQLATDLQAGEACPVCGSQEHPHPAQAVAADGELPRELDDVQAELEQAGKRFLPCRRKNCICGRRSAPKRRKFAASSQRSRKG